MSNLTVKGIFERDDVKKKVQEMVGKNSAGFISSILQVSTNNALLSKAEPMSIYNCAMLAAALNLSINPNLGHAYIVPYGNQAQFQIGWKGLVQLAQRSGQYKFINVIEVYENQFQSFNALTEELKADFEKDGMGLIVGYVAYFVLLNGFEKTVYWSKSKIEKHAAKFSKTYNNPRSVWKSDFDAMAKKTVLKNMLSKWGVLSIEMTQAVQGDQAIIKNHETMDVEYIDAGKEETKELLIDVDLTDIVEAIKSGNITFDDLNKQYDLNENQIKILKNV